MNSSVVQSPRLNEGTAERQEPSSWRLSVRRRVAAWTSFLMRLPQPFRVCSQPVCIVLEGASLGLLRTSDIDEMVSRSYDSEPQFYDPRHYQIAHEECILPAVQQRYVGDRRLLDAFCGQGREAEMFARAGFTVTAIDRIPWMIEKARSYASEVEFDAHFVTADFYSYAADEPFDVVYTSCWMYSTVQGTDRRIGFLRRCRELCSSDGAVVISYVSSRHGSQFASWIRHLSARLAAFVCRGNSQTELGERIYTGLFWHHLSEEVVNREVERAGLCTEQILPGMNAEPTFRILRLPTTRGTT